MWWSVRAIDGVAGLALSGVVAVGGLLAVTVPPHGPPPVDTAYPTGPVASETAPAVEEPSPGVTETPRAEPDRRPRQETEEPAPERQSPTPSEQQPDPAPPSDAPPAPAPALVPALVPTLVPTPLPAPAPRAGLPGADAPPTGPPVGTGSVDLVVSSFNVLGTSHTRHGERGFAPGAVRAQWAAQLIREHGVDIVGLQELQPDQMGVVTRELGEYDIWPGNALGRRGHPSVNSIMWRTDRWQAVESRTTPIPYFHGKTYQMPYLRLRSVQTGLEVWVANFHNPASTKRVGNQSQWRAEARRRQIALANTLYGETGVPVVFTGDMNERETYFCPFVGGTALEASNGGSVDGTRCSPPPNPRIDWIFGTPEIDWLSSVADRSGLVSRTTDHPMVVAHGRLSAGG